MAARKLRWFMFGAVSALVLCCAAFVVYLLFASADHDRLYVRGAELEECRAKLEELEQRSRPFTE